MQMGQNDSVVKPARESLPNKRACETIAFERNGLNYHATVGFFADRRPGEIFLNHDSSDSLADVLASDAAIAVSLALQFGCPVEIIRHALKRDARGQAASPIGTALDLLTVSP
jgi:hypothetical protein